MRFRHLPDGRMFVPARGRPPESPPGYTRDSGNPYLFCPTGTVTNEESSLRELYQHLYEDPMLNYGRASMRRCPGVKFYPEYKDFLKGKIFDFGCGRGDTVKMLQEEDYNSFGMDQIDLGSGMAVGDITKPIANLPAFDTGLCMDVFEHILDDGLIGLMANMAKGQRQIISVHTGSAFERGCTTDLHINRKSFEHWSAFIEGVFDIKEFRQLGKQRGIFFCVTRAA